MVRGNDQVFADECDKGLELRTWLAGQALAGSAVDHELATAVDVAKWAVMCADRVIEELNKEKTDGCVESL